MVPNRLAWALIALPFAAAAEGVPAPGRQAELVNLVRQDCGSCHGMTLKGGLGPNLLAERLTPLPDAFLIETILQGRPQNAMPPWKNMLTQDEVAWIVQALKKGHFE